MYVRKTMISELVPLKGLLDVFEPVTGTSTNWKHWKTIADERRCIVCEMMHGKIYAADEHPKPSPPVHIGCRCAINAMQTVIAGQASKENVNGADWWLKYYGYLPTYYITLNDLFNTGWNQGQSPARFAPGKMLTRGVYHNKNGHLPDAPGRIWYEADLNYYSGHRNAHRILWSNDGLIFVTYDHYRTFFEIV